MDSEMNLDGAEYEVIAACSSFRGVAAGGGSGEDGGAADVLELLLPLDVLADLPEGELMDDLEDEAASAISVIRSCHLFIADLG